jgi:uncharacterized protein YbaP (TraB family)
MAAEIIISGNSGLMRRLLGVAVLLAVSTNALADGHPLPMWQIDGPNNRIYLLGSIHLLRETDHPLPSAIIDAYDDADTLIMELDMDDLDPVATQALVNDLGMIKGGDTLSDLMGAELYAEAEKIAIDISIPLAMLSSTEPWLAAINVEQLILMRIGFDPNFGVESFLMRKAGDDKKEILGLESIEEQLGLLDRMSLEAQRSLLMQTLVDSADMEEVMDELVTAWRYGDIAFLEENMLTEMQEFPELYEALVVSRNRNWTQQIEALLLHDEDYLIIVGTLHLIGTDGVPNMLRERGKELWQVQQMN